MRSTFAPWILFFVAGVVVGCGDSADSASLDVTGDQGTDSVVVTEDILTEQTPSDIGSPDASVQDVAPQDVAPQDVIALDSGQSQTLDVNGDDIPIIDISVADVEDSGPVAVPQGLIGTPVSTPTLPPEFVAVIDSDGNEVNASDLLGSPTLMWFFPLPSTPG